MTISISDNITYISMCLICVAILYYYALFVINIGHICSFCILWNVLQNLYLAPGCTNAKAGTNLTFNTLLNFSPLKIDQWFDQFVHFWFNNFIFTNSFLLLLIGNEEKEREREKKEGRRIGYAFINCDTKEILFIYLCETVYD